MKGLDQSALAERVGISKSSMSRILSGAQEPRLRLASELAAALGVTLDYLVDEALDADPAGQVIVVSDDEMTILKLVRRLGPNVALDRLLKVATPLSDVEPNETGRGPARPPQGRRSGRRADQ